MMKNLNVTLQFNEVIHKEFFLKCLTKERLNSRTEKNRVKDLIDHYRIVEVSELDGSVHYSNQRETCLVPDEERDKILKKIVEDSAERIKKEFLAQFEQIKEDIFTKYLLNFLKDAITRQIECAYDSSLLELRIKQLQEEN